VIITITPAKRLRFLLVVVVTAKVEKLELI
jgi:hypothetical protein